MENFGLVSKPIDPQRWIYKTYSPLIGGEVNPSHDWEQWLPVVEYQNLYGFDTMACVTFSFLNCIETIWKFQGNPERNFSDRFLAKVSGTNRYGNTFDGVTDGARRKGLIDEALYPHNANSWNEYYKEITDDLLAEANKFLKEYEILDEYVRTYRVNDIKQALTESPLQVTVKWASGEGNLNPTGDWNHAVTCYGYVENEYWKIYDHYTQTKKRYAWSYEFGAINKFTLNKKNNNPKPMQIIDNTLYQLQVKQLDEKSIGRFAVGLDNRLIVDDLDKLQFTWIQRNSENGLFKGGKTQFVKLTEEEWLNIPKVNLKGETI